MNDFEIRTNQPIKYQICGNLRASDGFLHYKRSMELHVLIVVLKGTMYLRVGGENVIVRSGQYILLRAGEEHEGWKMSEGELSYFWVHFRSRLQREWRIRGIIITSRCLERFLLRSV